MKEICLYCARPLHGEYWHIKVDDGKPRGTPGRWRLVGYSCENHKKQAQEIADSNMNNGNK